MKQGILIYISVSSFALGVALYSFFSSQLALSFIIFIATLAFVLFVVVVIGEDSSGRFVTFIAVVLISFAFGSARMYLSVQPVYSVLDEDIGKEVVLEGLVIDEPDVRDNYTNLIIKVLSGDKVLVRAGAYQKFSYGDKLRIEGVIKKPESFTGEDGKVFNYPRYLAKDNIYYVLSYPKVKVLTKNNGNFVKFWLFYIKGKYLDAVERVIPEPASALAGGITVGAKKALGENLESDFRKTGIVHIVVLSGYNIVIISVFLLFILSFLPRFAGVVTGAVLIVLFAIMTGADATVVRASAMGLLALFALESGRTYSAMRALAVVGLAMLLWNPKILITDISFQLSFIATLGMIVGMPLVANYLHFISTKYKLREIVSATLSTQIAVLPLILYYMGQTSVVAPLVNVLVLPAVPIAMLLVFLTGVMGIIFSPFSILFGWFAYIPLAYILNVVDFFAQMPFASASVGSFSFIWVVIAYVLLATLVKSLYYNIPVSVS